MGTQFAPGHLASVTTIPLLDAPRLRAVRESIDIQADRLDADQFRRQYAHVVAEKCMRKTGFAATARREGHAALTDGPSAA